MMQGIFFLFLAVSLFLIVVAFVRRDPPMLALGGMLLLGLGLFVLDTSPDSGIEEDNEFIVRSVGDNDFDINIVKTFRNAGNDSSISVLGNVFLYTGMAVIVMSLGFFIEPMFRKRFVKL